MIAAAGDKPFVGAFVGTTASFELPSTARVAATLEAGVLETLQLLGRDVPDVVGDLDVQVAKAIGRLGDERTLVRGLYSGGTLCYESLTILGRSSDRCIRTRRSTRSSPCRRPTAVTSAWTSGEEEYTQGRPHPMIDPRARIDLLREQGAESDVAAILLDVVHRERLARRSGRPTRAGVRRDPSQGWTAGRRVRTRHRTGSAGLYRSAPHPRGRRLHRPTRPPPAPHWPRRHSPPETRNSPAENCDAMRIALLTYSTKPRGGVAHTLALGEALNAEGVDVRVVTLGDPDVGFYRPVAVPTVIVPAPPKLDTLEERVFASIAALEAGLRDLADDIDLFHAQDCISASAAARVRDAGVNVPVFAPCTTSTTSPQRRSSSARPVRSRNPTGFLCERALAQTTGHRVRGRGRCRAQRRRLPGSPGVAMPAAPSCARARACATSSCSCRSAASSPARAASILIAAMGELRATLTPPPVLAVVGGQSFQDYRAYREATLAHAAEIGLDLGRDIVLLGTVDDEELPHWYRAADALAFPSSRRAGGSRCSRRSRPSCRWSAATCRCSASFSSTASTRCCRRSATRGRSPLR